MLLKNNVIARTLRDLDHHLLVNYPVLWRTKFHYFLLFSFIGGNILAFFIPKLLIHSSTIPTEGNYAISLLLIGILFAFICIYWIYTQIKFKLQKGGFKNIIATMLVYVFAIASLFSNIWTYNHSASQRMANVVSSVEFEEDQKFLNKFNYLRGLSVTFNQKYEFLHDMEYASNEQEWANRFRSTLKKYGIALPYSNNSLSYERSRLLRLKVKTIEDAKRFAKCPKIKMDYPYCHPSVKRSFFHQYMLAGFYLTMFGILFLPSLLLMFSIGKFNQVLLSVLFTFLFFMAGLLLTASVRHDGVEIVITMFTMFLFSTMFAQLGAQSKSNLLSLSGKVFLLIIPITMLLIFHEFVFNASFVMELVFFTGILIMMNIVGAAIYSRTRFLPSS